MKLVLVALLAAFTPSSLQTPALDGTWHLEGFFGRFPIGVMSDRGICPTAAPLTDGPETEQLQPMGSFDAVLTITQNATAIAVGRKYSGSLGKGEYKDVFMLDGSESSTTNGDYTSKTTLKRDGASLVIDHAITKGGAAFCQVREVFSVEGNTLHLLATNQALGSPNTSKQTYIRK